MRWGGVRPALFLIMTLVLSSCAAHQLQELRYVEPGGSPFQQALTREYRRLSEEEQARYNWGYAIYYAEKSLAAAYGMEIDADPVPSSWEDLTIARQQLREALTGDQKTIRPQAAAEAQAAFDRWMVEQRKQARNWPGERTYAAREAFAEALAELAPAAPAAKPETKKAAPKKPTKAKPKSQKKPAKKPVKSPIKKSAAKSAAKKPGAFNPPPRAAVAKKPEPLPLPPVQTETASYIVRFDPGQATLTAPTKKNLDQAIKSVLPLATYHVTIHAEAEDPLGEELAAARARAVKDYLISQGISEAAIGLPSGPKETAESIHPAPIRVKRRVEILIAE